jgi:hypothetical protein
MKKFRNRNIFVFFTTVILAGVSDSLCSQSLNYPEIFGTDWKKAEDFISQNESWLKPVLKKYDVGFFEAMAVIFPELVRYSALRDKMETTLLKVLYINLGKEYADFSIGHLQMKPSFAELLGISAVGLPGHRYANLVRDSSDFSDIRDYRSSIIKDLEDTGSQINYLIVFFKICSKRFDLRKMDPEERIRFLATAYNYGFFKSGNEIRSMEGGKFFSTSLVARDYYSYADISVSWYKMHLEKQ